AAGQYVENSGQDVALTWTTPNVCLRAEGGIVTLQAASAQTYGIVIAADDAVLENFTLRGFAGSIALTKNGATQHRVTLEHVTVEAPVGQFRDGIVAYDDNRQLGGTPPTLDGLLLIDVHVSDVDLAVSCNAGPCAHWWIEGSRVSTRRG